MLEVRPFASLGTADHGWLRARFHFSFSGYQNPERVHWGALRVWNDDTIAAGGGFPPHPHQDMEIITYVRSGAITHEDSLGNKGRTEAGDVQVMSVGAGVVHSEFNHEDVTTTLFQIWILPSERGHRPSWGTRRFPKKDRSGHFVIFASGRPEDTEALKIGAHARVAGVSLKKGEDVVWTTDAEKYLYLVPATGKITINGVSASARDGVAITDETKLHIVAEEDTDLVLVESEAI
ncbi:pirin family protein [Acetobacter sp. AN02]|uniref:pirin family protein n=1 Tax=Acetobacter sp. AN02 TaxID=2894186 RepID=UPI0024342150|nr:pirin-like bicupin family protein [Acetobacter sp. AN02]MDG6094502.1 pirin family protein [Acetobacter sp. AN02]